MDIKKTAHNAHEGVYEDLRVGLVGVMIMLMIVIAGTIIWIARLFLPFLPVVVAGLFFTYALGRFIRATTWYQSLQKGNDKMDIKKNIDSGLALSVLVLLFGYVGSLLIVLGIWSVYILPGVMIGLLIGPLLVDLHLDAKRKHP